MKYSHLQRVLRSIRPKLRCPSCQKNFQLSDIEIVEIIDQDLYMCCTCETCDITIEAEVLSMEEDGIPQVQIYEDERISKQDIENISIALNTHKGSLKKLLAIKKSK